MMNFSDVDKEHIKRVLQDENEASAIKYVRDNYGVTLSEAEEIIGELKSDCKELSQSKDGVRTDDYKSNRNYNKVIAGIGVLVFICILIIGITSFGKKVNNEAVQTISDSSETVDDYDTETADVSETNEVSMGETIESESESNEDAETDNTSVSDTEKSGVNVWNDIGFEGMYTCSWLTDVINIYGKTELFFDYDEIMQYRDDGVLNSAEAVVDTMNEVGADYVAIWQFNEGEVFQEGFFVYLDKNGCICLTHSDDEYYYPNGTGETVDIIWDEIDFEGCKMYQDIVGRCGHPTRLYDEKNLVKGMEIGELEVDAALELVRIMGGVGASKVGIWISDVSESMFNGFISDGFYVFFDDYNSIKLVRGANGEQYKSSNDNTSEGDADEQEKETAGYDGCRTLDDFVNKYGSYTAAYTYEQLNEMLQYSYQNGGDTEWVIGAMSYFEESGAYICAMWIEGEIIAYFDENGEVIHVGKSGEEVYSNISE